MWQYTSKIALRIEVTEVPTIWAFCFIAPEKPGLSTSKRGKLLCAECACRFIAHQVLRQRCAPFTDDDWLLPSVGSVTNLAPH